MTQYQAPIATPAYLERRRAVDADPPMVSEAARTLIYYILLGMSALTLAASLLAPIWFSEIVAAQVTDTVSAIAAVVGLVAGGLGVAYRPTAERWP